MIDTDKQEILFFIEEYTEDNGDEPILATIQKELRMPHVRFYKAYKALREEGTLVSCKRSSNYKLK